MTALRPHVPVTDGSASDRLARDEDVLRAWVLGHTKAEIADAFLMSTASVAACIDRALAAHGDDVSLAHARAIESARVSAVVRVAAQIAMDPANQASARVSAASTILKASERMSRLYGLDAATRYVVDEGTTYRQDPADAMDVVLRDLISKMEALDD